MNIPINKNIPNNKKNVTFQNLRHNAYSISFTGVVTIFSMLEYFSL